MITGRVENVPEIGGFMIFLPSGATKTVHWRQAKPITPTLDAAKDYTAKVVESLLKVDQHHPDIAATNWTSVCAAVQRVILDWNDKVKDSRYMFVPYQPLGPDAASERSERGEEIAAMVSWLCTEDCSFTTGATFDLSGGPFYWASVLVVGVVTIAEHAMPLWQVAGLSSDPNCDFDIAGTIETTFNGGPTSVGLKALFVQ